MKRYLLVAMLGAGLSAAAQEPVQFKKLNFFNTDTTGDRLLNADALIAKRGLLPQATFSHNTSRGKIYTLPIDNMPCLVPDMKQVAAMPGKQFYPDTRMPNAMPKQRIIPKEEKENKR